MTTATGCSAAGLTASAVKDASGWSLEAGALVLADLGICAIDEFTALSVNEANIIHEAMEQQTISIAKSGLLVQLNCRCSLLAAANPKPSSAKGSKANDFDIKAPLLSRFDLIFRLCDPINQKVWDEKVCDFVLNNVRKGEQCEVYFSNNKISQNRCKWTIDRLRQYFAWVKATFKPRLSEDSSHILSEYFHHRRKFPNYKLVELGRLTPRLMDSLIRLTRAHARLCARHVTTIQDAVYAISLVDFSMQSILETNDYYHSESLDDETIGNINELLILRGSPEDPSVEYTELCDLISKKLNINLLTENVLTKLPDDVFSSPNMSRESAELGSQKKQSQELLKSPTISDFGDDNDANEEYSLSVISNNKRTTINSNLGSQAKRKNFIAIDDARRADEIIDSLFQEETSPVRVIPGEQTRINKENFFDKFACREDITLNKSLDVPRASTTILHPNLNFVSQENVQKSAAKHFDDIISSVFSEDVDHINFD